MLFVLCVHLICVRLACEMCGHWVGGNCGKHGNHGSRENRGSCGSSAVSIH